MKKELRLQTLAKLDQMSAEEFKRSTALLHERLFQLPAWKQANTVALTMSRGKEVPTMPLIEKAWREGKTVCVPTCFPETKEMTFYEYTPETKMISRYFGLLEPDPLTSAAASKESIDLIIVPGVCFDRKGYRIGYGGGYYDRYLADYHGETLALCLTVQQTEHIPAETHDIPVSIMVSEKGTIFPK
ncbi:5-formyltetrahydrofolate cyclo-ligase [Bacillus safensis]|uniref:5-formyltetrahydrofolate cyclo-ligase n=1 Tax=Bacillus TaxID=1386 RepID=UPI000F78F1C4|nr:MULTISPECIES: 5-formyltetrahydrofolate cyclo-ligase [Bacillus]MCY7470364.1 5-formyltetrahydrofolate cyclo-ligase [Bacillus safensis]MCY7510059.1 5-formyltetrahydrofolate cyclo-ligase [Bacillus safensis]MCY7515959.1 5-formyltetrahydrofolate cyclo-ligase [Bacillus safensis]MDJ0290084.1 5-formyltetrahydrofolate cyclo-ligase [Bacillus safensis]MED4707128.1 5-formyltetrahydrofolate cyclo-ligase [Bacillus safensis]